MHEWPGTGSGPLVSLYCLRMVVYSVGMKTLNMVLLLLLCVTMLATAAVSATPQIHNHTNPTPHSDHSKSSTPFHEQCPVCGYYFYSVASHLPRCKG